MTDKKPRILKGLASIGVGDVGGNFIGVAFWFLVAAVLFPEDFGELSFFMGIAALSATVALFGNSSLVVLIGKKVPIISSFTFFSLIVASGISVILGLVFTRLDLSLLIISLTIGMIGSSILTGKRQYRNFAVYNISQKVLLLVISFTFYFILEKELFLFAIGISYLIFIPTVIFGLRESKIDKNIFFKEKKFIITNYFHSLTGVFGKESDKFIIPAILGMATLGQYSLSIQIYAGMMLIPLVVNRFMLAEESADRSTGSLLKYAIIIQVSIAIIAIFSLPILIENFFPKYIETIEMIPIMSLSIIPGTIYGILIVKITSKKNNKVLFSATIIHVGVLISGLIILGSSLGPIGLAISHLLSYTIVSICVIIFFRKRIFTKINTDEKS